MRSVKQTLFRQIKDKKVIAYDLFDKKYSRDLKNFRFRVGTYGILKVGERILVQRHPLLRKYGLPGGGIDIGESISEGLYREFKEETGLKVKATHLIYVGEDMFTWNGEDAQGIFIYYEVKKVGGKLLTHGNSEDTAEVKFINMKKLSRENTQRVYWSAIKTYTKSLK